MGRKLFVLGGTGFIGQEVVVQAVAAGHTVHALARSGASAAALGALGAQVVRGEADHPDQWAEQLRGADVLIDLVQPPLPKRLGSRAIARIVARREAFATALGAQLAAIPDAERPVWFAISGADDLEPDASGTISHDSPLRSPLRGFSRIGVPARRAAERAGVEMTFVYFGGMVYGPGKGFVEYVVDALRKRRARVVGSGENRLPVVHVTDAAGALVHLAGLPREQLAGRTFLAMDGSDVTQRQLFDETAALMGRKSPGSAPAGLVALIAGKPAAELMTFDAHADISALLATGFSLRYPTISEGVRQTLADLGELKG